MLTLIGKRLLFAIPSLIGIVIVTFLLTRALPGLVISFAVELPLGVLAATRPGSWIDHLCWVTTTAGVSLPVFFTGLVLVYIFYFRLGWSPAPLGRLDVFYSAPPAVTGFYLIDALIARDFETFRSAF